MFVNHASSGRKIVFCFANVKRAALSRDQTEPCVTQRPDIATVLLECVAVYVANFYTASAFTPTQNASERLFPF